MQSQIKKRIFCLYLVTILRCAALASNQNNFFESDEFLKKFPKFEDNFFDTWLIYNSFNFDIYYYNEADVKEVINNIEKIYSFIIKDLDYIFYFSFKKIRIYIYKTQRDYVKKTGITSWAAGHADVKKNAIYSFRQKNLLNTIVHELTHLIFDTYMGYPRSMAISWLHEGLAVYQEKQFSKKRWNIKKFKEKPLSLKEAFKKHTGLETDSEKISEWYIGMGLLVAYLFSLDRAGFKVFCENLKIYKNVEVALNSTYPWEFKSVDELDKKWRAWLSKQKDII